MLRTIPHLLSLIRFSHTIFALPFALLSAMMAWRLQAKSIAQASSHAITETGSEIDSVWTAKFVFRWEEIVGILLCMVMARSAAMAFNRLVDRNLDAANPRTAARHLPAGTLSIGQVTAFTIACGCAFVASTLLFLPNRLPLYLSVPVLMFLGGYSFAKRFTFFAHAWLGVALALSPVAAWIAIRGDAVMQQPSDLLPAVVLGGVVMTWVTGFDILYACQDFDHDRRVGLHSVPVKFGVAGALRVAAVSHALTVALLALLPWAYPLFGPIYWLAVGAVAVLLVYEHALVRPDDLARVNTAFFHVNAVISLGLLAVGTLDLWLGCG